MGNMGRSEECQADKNQAQALTHVGSEFVDRPISRRSATDRLGLRAVDGLGIPSRQIGAYVSSQIGIPDVFVRSF